MFSGQLLINHFKKVFMGKKFNILTTFSIFHKSGVKTFFKIDC